MEKDMPSINILRLCLIIFMVIGILALLNRQWGLFFLTIQGTVLSLVPIFIEKRYKIHIPNIIKASIVLFVFASFILGEVQNFYNTIWWWDVALHFFAGFGVAIIAYIIMSAVYEQGTLKNNSAITSVFAVFFSIAVSVLWEIYEFAIEPFTETIMQPSLSDTMWDLIAATIGASLVVFSGWKHLKQKPNGHDPIQKVIEEGVRGNQ